MPDLREACHGRWRAILPQLGVPEKFLNGKNQPCPMCGGKDRARFIDREGDGWWICTHCGSGDGIKLVMMVNGIDFRTAREKIVQLVGTANKGWTSRATDADKRRNLNRLWSRSAEINMRHPVGRYLAKRVPGLNRAPTELRCLDSLRHREGGNFPCLLARVRNAEGRPVNLHRTYIRDDGSGKAPLEQPQMMMPGQAPHGLAVRLGPLAEHIGVAEGIETAISASGMFGLPVWATIGTAWLSSWVPPDGVKRVTIFADNDKNYAGHAAAYALAFRLSINLDVSVEVPPTPGHDWNDLHKTTEKSNGKIIENDPTKSSVDHAYAGSHQRANGTPRDVR